MATSGNLIKSSRESITLGLRGIDISRNKSPEKYFCRICVVRIQTEIRNKVTKFPEIILVVEIRDVA